MAIGVQVVGDGECIVDVEDAADVQKEFGFELIPIVGY